MWYKAAFKLQWFRTQKNFRQTWTETETYANQNTTFSIVGNPEN